MRTCLPTQVNVLTVALLVVTFFIQCSLSSLAQDAAPPSGKELFKSGKFADALSCFDKEVDEKPTDGAAHFWRAKCLASLGRVKDATAEYKLALLLSGDNTIKAQCKAALKQNNEAIPTGSVVPASGVESDKTFKLSTRKLDWNIQGSEGLQGNIQTQDARLAAAVSGAGTPLLQKMIGRSGFPNELAAELEHGDPHASFKLGAADLGTLRGSDVYIILDQSGSMGVPDCPAGGNIQNRLSWSVEELNGFADTLCKVLPHGFVFMTYNTNPSAHVVNDARAFSAFLSELRSEGGTTLAPALSLAFRAHENHLNQPMLIAIVTDGLIDVDDVKLQIAEATKRYYLPYGLFITFAQVGLSVDTSTFPQSEAVAQELNKLDDLQRTSGAAYDAVEIVHFRDLRQEGLGRAILKALRKYYPEKKIVEEKPVVKKKK